MFSKLIIPVLALTAAATAQNVTGPFAIHITGKTNTSIDGYVSACHAGAAIEGLCYTDAAGGIDLGQDYYQYYFNSSGYDYETGVPSQTGLLVWQLPLGGGANGTAEYVPSAMQIQPSWGSNVATPLFYPGLSYETYVSYDEAGALYLQGGVDDSDNNATYPSPPTYLGNLTNWNLCYQFTGGYYYYSVGWVFTQPPQNPSCQPVDLTMAPVS